ncbi:MAG: DUF6603 domain-containing protein [Acidobacteriota bacterium]
MSNNIQKIVLQELTLLLQPLIMAAQSNEYRQDLFASIGIDLTAITGLPVDELENLLTTIVNSYQVFKEVASTPPKTIEEFLAALDAAADLFEILDNLPTIIENLGQATSTEFKNLTRDLISFIVISYLRELFPPIYHLAVLLTIIQDEDSAPLCDPIYATDGKIVRLPYAKPELRLNRIAELVKDPITLLKNEYLTPNGLATAEDAQYTADKLFPRLGNFLASLGADVIYGWEPDYGINFGSFGNEIAMGTLMVEFPLFLGNSLPDSTFGFTLSLNPAEHGNLGLVVTPFGEFVFTHTTEEWEFVFDLTAGIAGFAIGANGLTLPDSLLTNTSVNARFTATKLPEIVEAEEQIEEDTEENIENTTEAEEEVKEVAFLLGSAKGTRLEIADFNLSGEVNLQSSQQDYGLLLEIGRAALVITASDGDAFLQEVLPPKELLAEFDFAIGWSKSNGFYFRGSAGLEGIIPLQAGIAGVLVIDSAHLAIRPNQDSSISAIVGATIYVQLGPFGLLVEKLGLEANFAFPPQSGNLAVTQLSLGFKLPDGVLLVINAGIVSGVGYLSYDKTRAQYAGVLMLEINGSIMLKAIGLLTTRMPDGKKGFSLLVILSLEGFTPIQLGFGFTLNGVGGLLGVNRTVVVDTLQSGLKTGALDAIFFPVDPITEITNIVNGLNNVFPIQRGHYVFGPMFILGWGTPTIITAEIAIVFELPSFSRLIILGRLKSALPSKEKPLIYIQVDVLGVIDFDKRTLSIDATLRDSKLAAYTLTGDMALRANWGEQPNFILAAGGFNPRFQPPSNFPNLERLAISLATGNNPRLRLEAYFALTSNTVQFGARLDLYTEAFDFSITGCLSFDALFQFSPFQFIADIIGMVALKHGASVLMSVQLDMTLSGPTPWHVRGNASFKVLGIKVSISFDKKFGPAEQPALPKPITVLPLLLEALRDKRNWSGQLPKQEHARVSVREISDNTAILVHPLSDLTISQRVVPLNLEISKYGNNTVFGERLFKITAVEIAGKPLPTVPATVTDLFAAGQFLEMSDSEKLASPSFEPMQSGIQIGMDAVSYGAPIETDIEYETIIVDENKGMSRLKGVKYKIPADRISIMTSINAIKQAAIDKTGQAKYRTNGLNIKLEPRDYVVATTSDLKIANIAEITGGNQTATQQALRKYLKAHPELRGKLQVVRKATGVIA